MHSPHNRPPGSGYQQSALMKTFPRSVKLTAAALALLISSMAWMELFYLRIIPAEIGISYPVARGGMWDLREGCGAAVYRIDTATTQALIRNGINYLPGTSHSRKSNDPYHTFSPWLPTPQAKFIDDDQTLLSPGLECAELDQHLQDQIERAARRPGAYYAYGPEKAVLIIPELRLVVLSYNG